MALIKQLNNGNIVKLVFSLTLIISLLIVTLYAGNFFSGISSPKKIVSLEGEWKISFDDLPSFAKPDFDDSGWDRIRLPGKIINYSINKTNKFKGICWLRKSFDINQSGNNKGLILGRIANADETYLNGERIGSTGGFSPNEFAMWNYTRSYPLPDNILNTKTKNIVAVRVSYNQIGEVLGLIAVTSMDDCIKYGTINNFMQISMGHMSIAAGISFFLLFALFYYKKPDSKEYFYYCLQLIVGVPIVLEICVGWNIYPGQTFRSTLLGMSWTAVNVAHPIFLHRVYSLKRVFVEKLLWIYLAIAFAGIFFTNESTLRSNALVLTIITWFIGFYIISCHVSALIKKRPDAKIFSFFGIAVVIFSMHDGLVYLIKYSSLQIDFMNSAPSIMVFHIGLILLYAGTSLVMVARFIDISTEIEGLNSTLENYIIENRILTDKLDTTRRQKKKQTIVISSTAEAKIKKVITLINDNYLQDLDRMGLAESVGVHPDNLSKQFKKYTGKKLVDYIYELRINEAAKKLLETDENIIDIAFAVGFESLRTFNRAFPKIMGITPDRYRKENQI